MPTSGQRAADGERGPEALVGEGRRHAHVDHGEVGALAVDGLDQGVAVAHRGHDLLAGVDEQAGQPGPQQHGVLGDHDPHRLPGELAARGAGAPREWSARRAG